MKHTLLFLVLSLSATGCKKKAAAPAAPDCAQAVGQSMALSKASMGVDDAMAQKMNDLGVKHCNDDKWPDDVRKCMAEAKAMADSQACYGKLPKEQQDKMNAE